MSDFNPYVVVLAGKSGAGKSSSLSGLTNQDKVLYLNCENGRALPFKSGFKEVIITHPEQVIDIITKAKSSDKYETIVIDSITYLMDMYETKVVLTSNDTRSAWSDYSQFFKRLMHTVADCKKNIIITGHAYTQYSETNMAYETCIPVKGALAKNGLESFFSTVIYCEKVSTGLLDNYQSDLLSIDEDEEELGVKHVLQTKLTRDTIDKRLKTPKGMFSKQETYIDSNVQLVLDRLKEYYV